MALSLWKGLVGIGLFALAHAAFSAAQRKCLRDTPFRCGTSEGGVRAHHRGSVRPNVPGMVIRDLRVWGDYKKRCGAPQWKIEATFEVGVWERAQSLTGAPNGMQRGSLRIQDR